MSASEPGQAGRVPEGQGLCHGTEGRRQHALLHDIQHLVKALYVTNNNSAASIGGGGPPRQALAPAITS